MGLNNIHKYPLVRILLPLLGGIFFADYYRETILVTPLPWLLSCIMTFSLLLGCHFFCRGINKRWYFGLFLNLLLFSLGVVRVIQIDTHREEFSLENTYYLGRVEASPKVKEKSIEYIIHIKKDQRTRSVLLFMPKDSLSTLYESGDIVAFYGVIKPPDQPISSYEFDYASFLRRKGISGLCFIKSSEVQKIGENKQPLKVFLDKQRDFIYNKFKALGFRGDELAIVSALTMGDKESLSDDLRSSYSKAGVSHVLALSGLHVGLLLVLLNGLFRIIFGKLYSKNSIASLCSICILWIFVLFVGASPSIIRAVILFSLLQLSKLVKRKGSNYNTLAFIALIMLFYNPYWLFDVGFILSFSAVLSIFLFSPILLKLWIVKNRWLHYMWALLIVSISAQLGVFPWILYFFGNFPVYFLLANFIAIPLVTLLLYGLVILFSFLPVLSEPCWLSNVVLILAEKLNASVLFFSKLPGASVGNLYIDKIELFFLFVVVLFLALLIRRHQPWTLYAFIGSLCFLSCIEIISFSIHRPANSLKIWDEGSFITLECTRMDGSLWILSPDSLASLPQATCRHQKRWFQNHYKTPFVVNSEYRTSNLYWNKHLLLFWGKSILIASKGVETIKNIKLNNKMPIDFIYLDRFFKSNLEVLSHSIGIQSVVLPYNYPKEKKTEVVNYCKTHNINLMVLERKGCIDFLE